MFTPSSGGYQPWDKFFIYTVPAMLFFTRKKNRIGLMHDTIEYKHDRSRFTHHIIKIMIDIR